jgi:uncharacterized membrane protein
VEASRAESAGIPSAGSLLLWAGIVLLIGDLFVLFVDFDNFDTSEASSPAFIISGVLLLLGAVVLLLALVRLYSEQWPAWGGFGRPAVTIAFLGGVLVAGAFWADLFVYPFLADEAPEVASSDPSGWFIRGFLLSFALSALGWLLVGIAILRSRQVPRWVAVLLIVGAVASLIPKYGGLLFFLAIAVLGYYLAGGRMARGASGSPPGAPAARRA